MGCWASRTARASHPCFLVGRIIDGKPLEWFNRQVVVFNVDTGEVEQGLVRAVEAGKGTIKGDQLIGRATVALTDYLCIVRDWAEKAMKDAPGESPEFVFEAVRAAVMENEPPSYGERTVELEIFRAYVENRTRNQVFVYKTPSSLPV